MSSAALRVDACRPMSVIQRSARVPYSASQMLNLVNDIVDAQMDAGSSMEMINLKIEFKSNSIDRCLV